MRRLAALSVLAIVGATACGGDDGGGSESTTGGGGAAVTTGASSIAPPPTEPAGADTVTDETTTDATVTEDTASGGSAPDGTTAGGGSVADDEGAYVDALVQDYSGDSPEVADCLATALVGGIGLEQLQEAGVSPQALIESPDLSALGLDITDRAATEAAVAECGDGYLVLALTDIEDTPEARACADEHLTDEVVARVVVTTSVGETPSQEDRDAADAFEACVSEG